MKYIYTFIVYTSLIATSFSQNKVLSLEITETPYIELKNPIYLCRDSIGIKHNFTIDESIVILDNEIDSFFIMNWSNLHLGLGHKKIKEADLFVPINTALRKEINANDTIGFSISYEITGEIGKRLIKVQWKDVKPKVTVAPNDVFNVQMIIDESDQSVSYHFGNMPAYFNTIFSLFGQGRSLALYFIDNFTSLSAKRIEIYCITPSIQDNKNLVLKKFILLDGQFYDELYSPYLAYDHPNANLNFGKKYKFYLRLNTSTLNNEISNSQLHISPNPATDLINLYSNKYSSGAYEIFNISGLVEANGTIESNQVNIESLPAGLHFVKFISGSGDIQFAKFMKI